MRSNLGIKIWDYRWFAFTSFAFPFWKKKYVKEKKQLVQDLILPLNFLQKKFATIARFYSGLTIADTFDVNEFARIKDPCISLCALDRCGWQRCYHQKVYHVSFCTVDHAAQYYVCSVWSVDWCCFHYFVRNSLVALLEALFAKVGQPKRRIKSGVNIRCFSVDRVDTCCIRVN